MYNVRVYIIIVILLQSYDISRMLYQLPMENMQRKIKRKLLEISLLTKMRYYTLWKISGKGMDFPLPTNTLLLSDAID